MHQIRLNLVHYFYILILILYKNIIFLNENTLIISLNQYQTNKENGYLIDTRLNAQDYYTNTVKNFLNND